MRSSPSSQFSERQLKQAIEWFVCLQSEQCPAEEQLRFETWLPKNDNHRAAYAEAERVWANIGTFNSDDIDPFLHALETILPVQAKRNGQQIQLRRLQ